jgi:hypothetical protein
MAVNRIKRCRYIFAGKFYTQRYTAQFKPVYLPARRRPAAKLMPWFETQTPQSDRVAEFVSALISSNSKSKIV